jgi:hypothetical protein
MLNLHALLDPMAELSANDTQRLVRGVRTWVLSHGALSLHRALGLPPTPQKVRQAVRDAHLRSAAQLPEGDPWQRAQQLHRSCQRFMRRQWPSWLHLDAPPAHAEPVPALLWYAARAAGGSLPESAQTMYRLILSAPQKAEVME